MKLLDKVSFGEIDVKDLFNIKLYLFDDIGLFDVLSEVFVLLFDIDEMVQFILLYFDVDYNFFVDVNCYS